jgi:hypothetical protein
VQAIRVALVAVFAYAAVLFFGAAIHVGGDMRVYFHVGDRFEHPAFVQEQHIPVIHDSFGYDGQFYLMIATDPLLTTHAMVPYIDAPAYRYRRIGAPLLASAVCAGTGARCASFAIPILLFIALGFGVWGASTYAQTLGRSAWWGLAWSALPAVAIGMPRYLPDVLATSLCMLGALFISQRRFWPAAACFAYAVLTRETTFLYPLAFAASALLKREYLRQTAIVCIASVVPLALWMLLLRARLGVVSEEAGAQFALPFSGIWQVVIDATSQHDQPSLTVRAVGNAISVVAFLSASAVGVRAFLLDKRDWVAILALFGTALGVLAGFKVWDSSNSSTRTLDCLYVAVFLLALRHQRRSWWVPLAIVGVLCLVPVLTTMSTTR